VTPHPPLAGDAGVQAERTLLAWRRTALALAVGVAVAARYLFDALGWWAVALGVAGVAVCAAVAVLATVRYRRVHADSARRAPQTSGGALAALLAAAVMVATVIGLALILTLWAPWVA
jgi:uncharacterized membrane protein YidH (DUF202 family)